MLISVIFSAVWSLIRRCVLPPFREFPKLNDNSDFTLDPNTKAPIQDENRLGRYLFRRPLVRGGLGVVSIYFDTEINREVALKEIRSEFADEPYQRAVFGNEARVTGMLEHPGVVPVYGMGTSLDGRPYYAMRLITGAELRDQVQEFHNALTSGEDSFTGSGLRRLIQRLIEVCNVIQYAHSRGVLHRDLKSINIMVGRYGETMVIDWGLAKTTGANVANDDDEPGESHSSPEAPVSASRSSHGETRDGAVMGTIAYAPPEQLNGRIDQIDARSDIYALGAVLYEILTGLPPCHGLELNQALRKIEQKSIQSPANVMKSVPRPLSAIAMQAIQLNREDRYSSASDLRRDLQRWLDDESVMAYEETWFEKASRWRRRHVVWVRWASVAVVLIAITSLIAVYKVNAAKSEVERARTEATQMLGFATDATDKLLTKTSDRLENLPGGTQLREQLLRDAAASYSRIIEVRSGDPLLRREVARAAFGLADIQRLSGDYDEGLQTVQSGLAVLHNQDSFADREMQARLLTLASRIHDPGSQEAESTVLEAIAIGKGLQREQAVVDQSHRLTMTYLRAILQRGIVAYDRFQDSGDRGELQAAVLSFSSVSGDLSRLLVTEELSPDLQSDANLLLTRAFNNEGIARSESDSTDHERIAECYEQALETARRFVDDESASSRFVREYSLALSNLADELTMNRQAGRAIELCDEAVEQFRQLAERYPAIPGYNNSLILATVIRGDASWGIGDHATAADDYARAYEVAVRLQRQADQFQELNPYATTIAFAFTKYAPFADGNSGEALLTKAETLDPDVGVLVVEGRIRIAMKNDRPEDVASLMQTFSDYRDRYNAACIISRTCQVLVMGNSQEWEKKVDSYLDLAVEHLRIAVEESPDVSESATNDPDLAFLRERRGASFLSVESDRLGVEK